MSTPHDKIFERWLAAEHDERDDAAERALGKVFAALPSALPSAGFSDRVLAAVHLKPSAASRPVAVAWWRRAAVAACLLLAGLSAALALPLVSSLTYLIAPGEAVGALVQGFVALISRLDELLSVWRLWARFVDIALLIATAPPVVLALLTLTTLSAFTFRGLKRALVPHRSCDHVQLNDVPFGYASAG